MDIMSDKQKSVEPIPEEFASYEEAAEFWDTHDTTDYPESFETVAIETDLKRRRYEVEIDEDLMKALHEKAQKMGVAVNQLVSEMLREKISPAA
jgi:predicted HicB family RNase H-like nuclease